MRRTMLGIAAAGLLASSAYVAMAGGHACSSTSESDAECSGVSRASAQSAAVCAPQGKIAGHFDPAMSGVCRYACAARTKYRNADVMAQPGAKSGKLTQCPVSGVVFVADASRPHLKVAGADYVTCCDKCATKLKKNPGRYLKA